MTARRTRAEREQEANEKALKAGKPRPALRESRKDKAEREAYEVKRKQEEADHARITAECDARVRFPPDGPPDPEPDP